MAAIICNRCKVLVLKTGDSVCLSCGAQNWDYEDEATVQKATITTPYTGDGLSGYIIQKKRERPARLFLYISIAAALFLIVLLAVPLRNVFNSGTRENIPAAGPPVLSQCSMSQSAIYEQYKYSVGLIWHEYVYEVRVNGSKPIEFTRSSSGQFILRSDGGQPITVTGTGFFADSAGLIVTNKHVVAPWTLNRGETKQLRNLVSSFLFSDLSSGDPVTRIKYGWRKRQTQETEPDTLTTGATPGTDSATETVAPLTAESYRIEVTPKTFFLGLALQNMMAEKKNYIPCTVLTTDPAVDLAIMRTDSGGLPPNAAYVDVRNCIMDKDSLRPGSRAVMVGFPMGMDLARGSNGKIRVQVQEGFINNESDERQVLYNIPSAHGASGSPVFNECGRLIAVNYAGYDDLPFNLGIPAKHVIFLLGRLKLTANNSPAPLQP